MHDDGIDPVSPWVARWAPLIAAGPVLDLACGAGRHARYLAGRGLEVVALDREPQSIEGVSFVRADLEDGTPWPFRGQRFGAIVVTNYLFRPLFPVIAASLAPQGVLLYETFMLGNERHGRPSNPDFLLRPGELLEAFAELSPVAFEQGEVEQPKRAVLQRICAVRGDIQGVRIRPHDHR